ncbi:hypothetical protein KR044_012884 [Drosophila immigrans]|nr:hypothetical protein KR044_012884 [Drosophila immigrans]
MEGGDNSDKYNADELVAPEWLNAEFLTEVLTNYEKEPRLKVLEFKITPASGKGDHYASVMFRAMVSFETGKGKFNKSLIIKTMPEQEGHKKEMLKDSPLFVTEIGMYSKVLPKFEEILRQAGDETQLCVPCVYHSLKPRQVIIFEDLVPQGYTVIRGRDGSIEEVKAGYAKLAKMQAVSFKILHENPDFLKDFKNGINSMPNVTSDPFFSTGISNMLEVLDSVPELSKYKPYLKSIEKTYLKDFLQVMEEYRSNRQPDGYYVLSHGDYHLRNMMFRYNPTNGSLEDCMLLDYQGCNVTPISADLINSIYLLMGPELRRESYKELLDFYFSTFVETLEKIGFKGELPNFVDFWRMLFRHRIIEMFCVAMLPIAFATEANDFELGELLSNNEVRKKAFFLEKYINELKYLLPRYEKLGYFKK